MPTRAPEVSRPDPTRPSLSPTFDLEPSPPRAPVRRNLFSAHLSRRPASTTSSDLSASRSASNSQTQLPSIPHASPFSSRPPQLHPSFSSGYDPTISPNRPISPKTSAALFPLPTSIIARDPTTGKPLLPQLPTLPRRLKLDDDDSDEAEDEDEDEDNQIEDADDADDADDQHQHAAHRGVNYNSNHQTRTHVASSSSAQSYSHQAGHDPFAVAPSPGHAPPDAAAAVTTTSSSSSPGTLAYPTTAAPTERDEEVLESQRLDAHIDNMMTRYRSRQYAKRTAHSKAATGGSRRLRQKAQIQHEADEALEKEELMNHLKSALRKEVYRAEEEAWMFGELERSWAYHGGGGGLDQDAGGSGMVMGGSAGVGTPYE